MAGVLEGTVVVDLSVGIAGAMATMLLADNGADVVTVEDLGGRSFAPYGGREVWLRNKRSVVLDRADPADRQVLRALVAGADVVVDTPEEIPGDDDLWGGAAPTLVRASITGYGRGSVRHAGRPAVDALVAARLGLQWDQRGAYGGMPAYIAGAAALASEPPADPEVPAGAEQTGHRPGPIFLGLPWPSIGAALLLTTGISAALLAREATGVGQRVETSLLQGSLLTTVPTWQRVPDPRTDGYRLAYFDRRHPKGLFRCSDGRWVHQWAPIDHAFVQVAGAGADLRLPAPEELDAWRAADAARRSEGAATTDRGADWGGGCPPPRSAYDEQLAAELRRHPATAAAFARFPSVAWVELFARAGRPCQPVRSPEEGLGDPWSLTDGCVAEVDDPVEGRIRQVGLVYRMSATPGRVGPGAPPPGRHTPGVRAAAGVGDRPAPSRLDAGGARRGGPLPPHALAGVRVVDLGTAMAGPYGTQTLADLGAAVIKVHNPAERRAPVSSPVLACNRGKRSIAVDLKDGRGREVLRRLVADADVVHHNLRTGVAERLGAGADELRARHPRLVYCHTRGFEAGGPRVGLPGNDQMGQALAGSWHEMGGGHDGGAPVWHPAALGDFGNGVVSAIAVIQALYHRARTGEGQVVDTSILNVGFLYNSSTFARADGTGPDRARLDREQLGFGALHRLYRTADGWLCVAVATDEEWRALVGAVGDRALAAASFATADRRRRHDADLAAIVGARLATATTAAWCDRLDAAGVPCEASTPAFARELWDDPELRAAGRVVGYPHPTLGHVEQVGHLVELSATPGRIQGVAPLVGQHSRAILAELGYRDGDIAALVDAGVVWAQAGVDSDSSSTARSPR